MLVRLTDPRFIISVFVLLLFGVAFAVNDQDDTMKGAIIGALNIAVGYWLGSSNSAVNAGVRQDQAMSLAHDAVRALPNPPKPDVELEPGETARAKDTSVEQGK